MILYLTEHESATMEELCRHFDVSMNTIRRDVARIVSDGHAEKVYGGVRIRRRVSGFVPYEQRSLTPSPSKQAICNEAASLVQDGDIIFIDSGTTTVHLMDALREKNITVITNNIEVMVRSMDCPGIRLIVLPGEFHRTAHAIAGEASADYLSRYNTHIAFMAATGVSLSGATHSIALEYGLKKAAVAHTDRAVLMVTGNKFGISSLLTYAPLEAFDSIYTDPRIPSSWIEILRNRNVRTQIVQVGTRHS